MGKVTSEEILRECFTPPPIMTLMPNKLIPYLTNVQTLERKDDEVYYFKKEEE